MPFSIWILSLCTGGGEGKTKGKEACGPDQSILLERRKANSYFYFRMSVESFKELLAYVEPDIIHAHTNMRNPISPTERLLITLR